MSITQDLKEVNQLVLDAISQSSDEITLGLLPVSAKDDEEIIRFITECAGGDLNKLLMMLRRYAPAAASYTIASCASQAVTQGRNFWAPVSEKLKIDISNTDHRKKLSSLYVKTCRRLGVIVPDVSSLAWSHIAPMMAQASILHAWNDHLASGLQTTLRYHPAPDLDDEVALEKFTLALASHIRYSQNLQNILRTEIGSIVTKRVVSSYIFDQYELLPAHLRGPMKLAFSTSGNSLHLKSPYIAFSEITNQLEIVLPKQPNRLVSQKSHWSLNGRQYPALELTRISELDLLGREFSIQLHNLQQNFPDQEFLVDLTMEHGFMVFDEKNFRKRPVKACEDNALPPGEYCVVMLKHISTNDSKYEEDRGKYKVLPHVDLRPGAEALEIVHDDCTTQLSTSLKAGIYTTRNASNAIRLNDDSFLHYGDTFQIDFFIPDNQHTGEANLTIDVDGAVIHSETVTLESTSKGVYSYSDALATSTATACSSLAPGIYKLTLKVSTSDSAASKDIWYWKDLRDISNTNGFLCNAAPTNIDFKNSIGLRVNGQNCVFTKHYNAPFVQLSLRAHDEALIIPRPGVQATLIDLEDEWSEPLSHRSSLSVLHADKRIARFHSGGFHSWEVQCNAKKLCDLTEKKLSRSISLSSLTAEFGNSGTVTAINELGEKRTLLTFASDLVSSTLRLEPNHSKQTYNWKTKLALERIGTLGIQITDYGQSPSGITQDPIEMPLEELCDDTADSPLTLSDIIDIRLKKIDASNRHPERIMLEIIVKDEHTSNELQLIEVMHKPEGTEVWRNLSCKDGVNTSQLSLLVTGSDLVEEGSNWWRHLWRTSSATSVLEETSIYDNITNTDLSEGLKCTSMLASIKYPSSVYNHSARHFTSLAHKLSERRKLSGKRDAIQWWDAQVNELSKHASLSQTPVTKAFLLSSNWELLGFRYVPNAEEACKTDKIHQSFSLISRVQDANGTVPYAGANYPFGTHPEELYHSFKNSGNVMAGKASTFDTFDFHQFFKGILEKCEKHEESATDLSNTPVLSARHLLNAGKMLNKRTRLLASVALSDDSDHILANRVQALSEIHRNVSLKARSIHKPICFPPFTKSRIMGFNEVTENFDFPEWPALTSDQSSQIADISWALACVSRTAAHGLISSAEFKKHMTLFTGKSLTEAPINIVFSFAPELFAYQFALLDFALLK